MYLPERALRRQLLQFSHLCYQQGLLVGMDGNLSVRLTDELVLCTRAGTHKGLLEDRDLLVVDMKGRKLRGQGRPTSEIHMHLACYANRPDVAAVVHAHPPTCIAFSVAGISLARCILPEVVLTLGAIPTLPYETTGTNELADRVGRAMVDHDAVILDHHGAVAVGPDLLTAFCNLETLEHTAKITHAARTLGEPIDLPADEAVKLRKMGIRRYGAAPGAVARLDHPAADLPEACVACSGCANPSPHGIGARKDLRVARFSV